MARLHLKVDYDEVARELGIDGPYSVTYHLHPPILRRIGMRKKLALGSQLRRRRSACSAGCDACAARPSTSSAGTGTGAWSAPWCTSTGSWWSSRSPMTSLSYEDRVAIAESALAVKGYAQVKERSVARWRAQLGHAPSGGSGLT